MVQCIECLKTELEIALRTKVNVLKEADIDILISRSDDRSDAGIAGPILASGNTHKRSSVEPL